MDEQRLRELFREAVRDAPPASFGRDEVVASARRSTARRRAALAGGTALGIVVLVGSVFAGNQLLPGQLPSTQFPSTQPLADDPGSQAVSAPPEAETLDARAEPGCGPVDQRLAAEAQDVLADRSIPVLGPASEVTLRCPPGVRSAALLVPEGTLQVLVLPPAHASALDPSLGYPVLLDDGRVLVVHPVPSVPGQPDPLADQLPGLAHDLAARL